MVEHFFQQHVARVGVFKGENVTTDLLRNTRRYVSLFLKIHGAMNIDVPLVLFQRVLREADQEAIAVVGPDPSYKTVLG